MEIWQAVLTAAGTCFATLLVTFVFNWFTNRPKKRREEEAKREEQRKKHCRKQFETRSDMEILFSDALERVSQNKHKPLL